MSVKIGVFERDGMKFPTVELKAGKDDKFAFTFGLSKARLIIENLDAIKKFVEDNPVEEKKAETNGKATAKASSKKTAKASK